MNIIKAKRWLGAFCAAAGLAVAASAALPMAVNAADVTWSNAETNDGDVTKDGNWVGDAKPGAEDTAAIGDAPEANLSNGSATYAHLKLGTENGKTGKLTVGSGGKLTVTNETDTLLMGNADGSAGELTINGGEVTVETLGTPNYAATSTVNMVSGNLTINSWADWGRNANGLATFNQSGGTVDLKKNLEIGRDNSGTGIYNMSGGVLNGADGGNFVIGGRKDNCVGTFNLTDGTVKFGNKGVYLGNAAKSKGNFLQSGGTVSSKSELYVGNKGTGSYTISGGTFTSSANITLGSTSGASGVVTQDGGIVSMKDVRAGDASGATGRYTLNAGTNMTSTGWVQIGCSGVGEYIQNGGELQINNSKKMQLAEQATGEGLYVISGGLCSVDGDDIVVGCKGTGVFVMNGGTVAAKKISSGTKAGAQGRVLLNGGMFKATAAGTLFANGNANSTNDWTLGRDFTIDTNGKDVSSAMTLAATSGSSLTKDGEGTLTLAALPQADSVTVKKGTLVLSFGGDNTKSVALAHRWSFNGNANDSVGGATGTLVGSAVYTNDNTAVYLPGGNNGTSYVNLGKGLIAGDNLTLEFWAKRCGWMRYARIFDCGTDTNNFIMVSWTKSGEDSTPKLAVKYGEEKNKSFSGGFEDNVMNHISVRFRKNADGSTTITCTRRAIGVGELGETIELKLSGLDAGWTLDKVATANLNLGHNDLYSDKDANAVYDEVRVWHGALSDEALTLSAQKGADATAEDIAAIVAKNDESVSVDRTVAVASGATLDIGGNTLTQPVLDVGGTLANGTLVVTKGLVVAPGQTMTVANGATLDLSAVKEVSLKDDSATIPAGGWVIASGEIALGGEVRKEIKLTGALSGYTLFLTSTRAWIGRHGLIISFH